MQSTLSLLTNIYHSQDLSSEFFNKCSSLQSPDLNSIKRNVNEVKKFLQNVVIACNLDFGEICTIEKNGRFRPYSTANNIGDKYNYGQISGFKTCCIRAIQTTYPQNLDSFSNSNIIAYPLFVNEKPLGVLVLRGSMNSNPHSFVGMPVNVIRNLITIISRGLSGERSNQLIYNSFHNSMEKFLLSVYGFNSTNAIHCNKTSDKAEKLAIRIGLSKSAVQTIKLELIYMI